MGIVEEICEEILRKGSKRTVPVDYCIGLKYSYVEVKGPKGRSLGVAYVPIEDLHSGCLADPPEEERIEEFLTGPDPLKRSLGLAHLNAISQYLIWNEDPSSKITLGDLIELTTQEVGRKAKIAVIGNMKPLVRRLEEEGHEVLVFERNPSFRGKCLPDVYLKRFGKEADAFIVTGTSLLNDTLEEILEVSEGKFRGIVGPTCGCLPEVLLKYFDFVASMRMGEIEKIKSIIRRGGGRWSFTPFTDQYLALP